MYNIGPQTRGSVLPARSKAQTAPVARLLSGTDLRAGTMEVSAPSLEVPVLSSRKLPAAALTAVDKVVAQRSEDVDMSAQESQSRPASPTPSEGSTGSYATTCKGLATNSTGYESIGSQRVRTVSKYTSRAAGTSKRIEAEFPAHPAADVAPRVGEEVVADGVGSAAPGPPEQGTGQLPSDGPGGGSSDNESPPPTMPRERARSRSRSSSASSDRTVALGQETFPAHHTPLRQSFLPGPALAQPQFDARQASGRVQTAQVQGRGEDASPASQPEGGG